MTKEEQKEYDKKYNQTHKEERRAFGKKYYQVHKEHFKQLYQLHREEIRTYAKKYRQAHRKSPKIRIYHSCSEETKRKISLANKGKVRSEEMRKKMSEVQKGKLANSPEHDFQISKNIEEFRKDGYICVRIDRRPYPDFIAFKNNKAYAVEVEGNHIRPSRYTGNTDYADIIWIWFKRQRK